MQIVLCERQLDPLLKKQQVDGNRNRSVHAVLTLAGLCSGVPSL